MASADPSPGYCDLSRARLESEGVLRAVLDGVEILAASTPEGIRVYSGVCPHLGGPLLEGRVRDGVVRCPWHHYEFDLVSSECLTVPGRPWRARVDAGTAAREPLRARLVPLKFEVADDRIRVYLPGP